MKHFYSNLLRGFVVLCLGMLALSCSRTDLEPIPKPKDLTPRVVAQLTYEQALQRALSAVESIGGNQTKSAVRRVKSHNVLRADHSVVTRSAGLNSDSLMYIFNFEDNMGFAIIPSDPRTSAAIAMSDVGNFDASGTTSGDTMLMTLLEDYQLMAIGRIGDTGGPNNPNTWVDGDDGDPHLQSVYGPWVVTYKKESMLTTKWGQSAFNASSPEGWNDYIEHRYVAGCVTIATAQLLSYFRFPNSADGFTYNWNDMLNDSYGMPCESTKRFIACVYNHLPGKTPGYTSTGIPDRSVVDCLSDLGCRDDGQEYDYDYTRIINSIDGGSPVLMDGYSKVIYVLGIPFNDQSTGHMWVVDGYMNKMQEIAIYPENYVTNGALQIKPISTHYLYSNYLHCNWGWGGVADGYYQAGVFNTINGPVELGETDLNIGKGKSHYSYDMDIRVNIKPR